MATASTAPFEELTKLASDFVTSQKGMWDHKAWTDFLSRVQQKGVGVSDWRNGDRTRCCGAMQQCENRPRPVRDPISFLTASYAGLCNGRPVPFFSLTNPRNRMPPELDDG